MVQGGSRKEGHLGRNHLQTIGRQDYYKCRKESFLERIESNLYKSIVSDEIERLVNQRMSPSLRVDWCSI